jgi:acyl-CoA thioester hydrolase
MFSITVTPRFGDIDGLGHANNIAPATWFELARNPVMRIFDPQLSLDPKYFTLIMVHADYDFIDQVFLKTDVEIKTWISKIGTKSFTVHHQAWQEGRLCAEGSAVLVNYDFSAGQSFPIPDHQRKILEEHLIQEK